MSVGHSRIRETSDEVLIWESKRSSIDMDALRAKSSESGFWQD